MNRTNKIIYGSLAVLLLVGLYIGLGFIIGLFWKIDHNNALIYWITKGIVCFFVLLYSVIILLKGKDSGVGTMQLFFTGFLAVVPIVCRAIYFIPVAGPYIALILAILCVAAYLLTMLGMGYYATEINNNSDNTKKN